MGSGEKRARSADRDLAVDFIEEAWVDGQLSREEYDERVARVLVAATLTEVEREVRDLQGPGGAVWRPTLPEVRPVVAAPAPVPQPAPVPRRVVTSAEEGPPWGRYLGGVGLVIVSLFIAGNVADRVGESSFSELDAVDASSMVDLEELASTVEEEFDTTTVFSVVARGGQYTVILPHDNSSQRAYESTWDSDAGTWSAPKETTSKRQRLDLANVDVDIEGVMIQAWNSLVDVEDVVTRVRIGTHEGTPTCLTTRALAGGEESTQHYDCEGRLLE